MKNSLLLTLCFTLIAAHVFAWDFNPISHISSFSVDKTTKKASFSIIVLNDIDGEANDDNLDYATFTINGRDYFYIACGYAAGYGNSDMFFEVCGQDEESWGITYHAAGNVTANLSPVGTTMRLDISFDLDEADYYASSYNLGFNNLKFEDEGGDYTGSNSSILTAEGWPAITLSSFSATNDDCGQVGLTWAISAGREQDIYYSVRCDGPEVTKLQNQFSYNHSLGSAESRAYNYTVVAGYGSGLSRSTSRTAVGGPPRTNYTNVSGFSVTNHTCNQIELNWNDASSGSATEKYAISWTGGGMATIDKGESTYTINSNLQEQSYQITIKSQNECGFKTSGVTRTSSVTPLVAPNTPTTTILESGAIQLNWSGASGQQKYIIEKSTPDNTVTIDNVDAGATQYIDENVSGCVTYTYKLFAANDCTPGGLANASTSIRIDPDLSTTFTESKRLVASKGYYNDKVVLKWEYNNSAIIDKLKIYRKEYGSSQDPVLLASIDPTASYIDETAEAGIYYEYTIVGESPCEDDMLTSPQNVYAKDIGFRVPTAVVSGAVTFEGGSGVPGVSVIAETDDDFGGHSLAFDGVNNYMTIADDDFNKFDFDTAFSFQAWVKPQSTGTSTIFKKGNQYQLTHSQNTLNFTAGGQTLTLNFTEKQDTFFCVNAIRSADSLFLYVLYDELTYQKTSVVFSGSTAATTSDIYIGSSGAGAYFNGYIEDLRLWHKSLNFEDVLNTSIRYIVGNETGLSAYYRLNESFNNTVYDISRSGANFNANHAIISGASLSEDVPFNRQLSVKGITDENGNYLITGIPYTIGSVYRIIPIFEVHEFDPNQRQLYIGPGSNTHSGVDFVDIAAFRITGNIVYKDTYFPVKGANFYIDGQIVTGADGIPLTSDANGNYEIYVPIGWHYFEVRKYGHVFVDEGRFPIGEGNYNFQAPISGLNFTDSTLIKVVGRVAGGPIQASKPIGLGQTVNNIGNATIVMTTQKGFDITRNGIDSTWSNDIYRDDVHENIGETDFSIAAMNPRNITLNPDPVTGEYVAYLLPEKYQITGITAGDYTFDDSYNITLDLSNKFYWQTEYDSVVTDLAFNSQGDTIFYYRVDSIQYQHNQDFIYRVGPTVDVTHKSGDEMFWEDKIVTAEGDTVTIVNNDGSPKTPYPVFVQRNKYKLKVSVFEQYINADNGNAVDNVPVTDGRVEIQNSLAIQKDRITLDIDKNGEVYYNFTGGLPNITTGGVGDYLKSFNIVAKTGTNGAISTAWLPGGNSFLGYVFGGMPTGNNFVTKGPDQVKMILRDPPGSNSFAYLEQGTSFSTTSSTTISNSETTSMGLNVDLGTKIVTFAGLGAGVITENEVVNEVNVGLEASMSFVDNETMTETFTLTETWQTSPSEDYVGSDGDLFIGNSTNIVYGVSTQIDLLPVDKGEGHIGASFDENGVTYDIGMIKSIRVSPEFNTAFMFTQNHIKNALIPNLEMIRNNFLLNQPDVYQCVNCDQNSPDFGKPNTTGDYVADGYQGGDSYNIDIPDGWPADSLFEDSVAFYNEQIKMWENWLAYNEEEKINSVLDRNLSFDAGAIYENSISYEKTEESTYEFTFSVSPSVSQEVGFEIMGCGSKFSMAQSYTYEETNSSGESTTNSTTFGYVLEDGNADDYISVDVKEPPTQTGPVFVTRGGQTSCPYEDGEFTEYYNPGSPLNEATMKREVPVIGCENPIQIDIPEDAAGIFNIQLSNAAETGDDQWFVISIDEQSNQDGALIKMDGTAINDGRMVMVPAGETINKILTVEKVQPDVYEYEDLAIIWHSACQFDPTANFTNIADTVRISAYFQRVCSGITLGNPANQWIVNTNGDTTLTINIEDYNLEHGTLEKIYFQHKSSSTPTWSTGMIYYMNQADYDMASEPKELIDEQSSLSYVFDMVDMQDRNYDIKVKTVCTDGTINESIVASGIKDVKRPKVFGTPQPGDGILNPGEDVMITFDETIQAGALTPYNFSVRGVLNGSELRHEAAMFFDGIDDYASVQRGINLNNKSYTISFWIRRGDNTPGAIFAQSDVEIGFNSGNQLYFKTGEQEIVSGQAYTDTETWYHCAVTYSAETNVYGMFINDIIEREDIPKTAEYNGDGKMYLGRNVDGNNFFNGYIHELRIWEDALGFGNIYALMYQSLAGNEIGLAGYWPCDEASGTMAADKCRSNHALMFDAGWQVFPTGFAHIFDGVDDYMSMNTGSSVVISDKMDFTIEFYFKGEPQSNTIMFSNGNEQGLDVTPPYDDIWVVGFNVNGKLFTKNNGTAITVTGQDFDDNKWHHFALVCNRLANTSIYIDGNLQAYKQSSLFGGLVGAEMIAGACRNQQVPGPSNIYYDRFFNGSMDEIRIWGLAKTVKQIDLDMNCKLQGDEMGLFAYYPFEEFDNIGDLTSSLIDYTDETNIAVSNANFTNIDVPTIKNARPVQDVAFDWVVNDDKVIININEQPSAIEKCILEFTVDRVEDMRENRIASPVTWTAYVKQNTVTWGEDRLEFEKELYEPLSFNVDIFNTGGTEQNYSITNLPAWLSCSQSTGILGPDSYTTVSFDVNEALNIGDYTVSLYLTSDFGYNEKLDLNISVRKQAPDWNVNPANFQYSANVIAQLLVDSIISTDEDDMIAAFVNGECRGVEKLEYVQEFDAYMAFIDVYSNIEFGDNVVFRVWDASSGQIITQVTPNLTFEANTVYGTPDVPLQLYASSYYEGQIALNQGWNWMSFNLNAPNLNNLPSLMSDINVTDNTIVKGQTAYDIYSAQAGAWYGNLTANNGINNNQMYMMKLANTDTLIYEGPKADVQIPIDLEIGWNWISYKPQMALEIEEAFASFAPTSGDLVKNQTEFAMYNSSLGWIGSLEMLQPGKGYMYKALSQGQLVYPEQSIMSIMSINPQIFGNESPWEYQASNYQYNMNMVIQVRENDYADNTNYILGAFVNSVCRGYVNASEINGKNFYFLTVSGEVADEEIRFMLYNPETESYINIEETCTFEPNKIEGELTDPFVINFNNETTSVNELNAQNISVYPNPFSDKVEIVFSSADDVENIEIYNVLGQSIYSFNKTDIVNNIITWNGTDSNGKKIASGVYVISVKTTNGEVHKNVIKK